MNDHATTMPFLTRVPSTFGVGLLTSLKAIRTVLQVQLPTQVILMCGNLVLKPIVAPHKGRGRESIHKSADDVDLKVCITFLML